jgi:DNA-binding transcriptional LysR family regulator
MDRFRELECFIAVVDQSSFSEAARRLGVSAPVVTRAVASLEARLGARLLTRTTRQVRTTELGVSYALHAQQLLEDFRDLDESVVETNQQPKGRLVITAPVLFGRQHVLPVVTRFLKSHPEVDLWAYFVDRVVNYIDEGIDVGIRIGELPDSRLQATPISSVRFQVCASPSYLQKHGKPKTPAELSEHTIISSHAGDFSVNWEFANGRAVKLSPRLSFTTNDAALEAALNGFGITRLLSYQIEPQIQTGELVPMLEEFEPARMPVNILHREGRYPSAKNRMFVDMLKDTIRLE